jgi:hypothetical protein
MGNIEAEKKGDNWIEPAFSDRKTFTWLVGRPGPGDGCKQVFDSTPQERNSFRAEALLFFKTLECRGRKDTLPATMRILRHNKHATSGICFRKVRIGDGELIYSRRRFLDVRLEQKQTWE